MDFKLFPAELKELPQWCAAGAGEPGSSQYKAPINPKTKGWAKVNDPSTWGTFDEAVAAGYPLVGFVFHHSDPYTVIDLDTYKAPNEDVKQLHDAILRHADTYTEISQSGHGTHIICRGRIQEGSRNEANAIEVYSEGRFMICTGHTVGQVKPITEQQPLVDYLFSLLKRAPHGASLNWRDLGPGEASDLTDAELVERASNADNGEKFDALCRGDMSAYGNDHSAADAALIQFLCFYSTDNEQVQRIFHMSPLGQREKAYRPDYVPRTIARMREKIESDKIPLVDPSAIIARARAVELSAIPAPTNEDSAQPEATPPTPFIDVQPATFPPGLVGDIAAYVLKSSIRPVPEVALATAIAVMSGIVGRNYNISNTGLNQYILLLAKTGTGKESVQSSVDRLMAEVQKTVPAADRFVGPAHFSSGPALVKQFQERPCFMSVLGEFGHRLRAMAHPRANGAEKTLMAAMLDLYSKSGWGQMLRASVYSDKEKNTAPVHAPALTLLGETEPDGFFGHLDEATIASGFLPRFLMIEYAGDRPRRNRKANAVPSRELVQKVSDLCASVLQMEQSNTCLTVPMEPAAVTILDEFDEYADEQIRGSDEVTRQLWNRAHLKALRLSALIAVGVNPYAAAISKRHAEWAINMVQKDTLTLLERFKQGDVGEGDSKLQADLTKVIKKYLTTSNLKGTDSFAARGCIPVRHLQQQTANRSAFKNHRLGATRALKDTLSHMVDAGLLVIVSKEQAREWFKTSSTIYAIGDQWGV